MRSLYAKLLNDCLVSAARRGGYEVILSLYETLQKVNHIATTPKLTPSSAHKIIELLIERKKPTYHWFKTVHPKTPPSAKVSCVLVTGGCGTDIRNLHFHGVFKYLARRALAKLSGM